jgi:hypothetical protein
MSEPTEAYTVAHVQEHLARDRRVNEPELEVQVIGGTVYITGTLPTEERRAAVADVVRECCPDLDVENRTTVADYPATGETERVR